MDEYEDIEMRLDLLPGVDLALWVRLIGFALLLVALGGVVTALVR